MKSVGGSERVRAFRVSTAFLVVGSSAVLLLGGCTPNGAEGAVTSNPSGSLRPAVPGTSRSTDAAASSTPAGDAVEFSPASVQVLGQKSVMDKGNPTVVLRVKAPEHTSFRIGRTGSDGDTIDCRSVIVRQGTVLYEVHCVRHDAADQLYASIAYGDFDYGFTKALK